MAQEKKTVEQLKEEMKALQAQMAEAKKAEKSEAKKAENEKIRNANSVVVKEAIALLNSLPENAKKELSPAIIRLEMYCNGERYTRNKGGKNE